MIKLSQDQADAIDAIKAWYRSNGDEFRLGGLAGTGKTTIITQLPEILKTKDVAFMAYTGKAASVLTRKLRSQFLAATTIHQFMYQPREAHCGVCPSNKGDDCHGPGGHCGPSSDEPFAAPVCGLSFRYLPPEDPPQLLIIDEASMVDVNTYEHLKEVGSQMLFVGDHGQLGPVRSKGGFSLMAEDDLAVKLEHIHRQVEGSAILQLAMRVRSGKRLVPGEYGDGVRVLPRSIIARSGFDIDKETLLICYTNRERKRINRVVREALFGEDVTDLPRQHDKVVCLKNNHQKGLANGMLGEVLNCYQSGNFYNMNVKMFDSDMVVRTTVSVDQFHGGEMERGRLPRGVDMWTWGYCLTAHKAQGSEADHVVVFLEASLLQTMSRSDVRRWMYTAITRAKKQLVIYTPG